MAAPWLSVIVNTYNRAAFLRNCLEGYLRQTAGGFEIVVADDGSTDGTAEVVASFAARAPFAVRHVWHEHQGHRRAAILNKGIAAAQAPYVLFTDADSIPAADLVAMHQRHREPRRMLIGGCVRLTAEQTAGLEPTAVARGEHERFLDRRWRRRLWLKHLKNCWQIWIRKKRRPHNLGLNYSVAREHLLAINGYDEDYRGWGNADGDVRRRLRMIGVEPKSACHRAIVFHQHHPPDPTRTPEIRARNQALSRRPDIPAYCARGLDQHLQPVGAS
ncbi:MAG: glycosyl transferase [Planctomycetota bacterium]|nr:MAG: glycosyl transferase [Planctomycetota bacterium]